MRKTGVPGTPYCKYCKRLLTPSGEQAGTALTFDHVKPQSDGGWRRVPCCRTCNQLKGNLPMEDWFWFIGAFKRWWKTFSTPAQVRDVVREEYRRRALANAARAD